jgi:hypothetical protein
VLVPVFLNPLKEFQVVLHATLCEGLDGDGLVDLVTGEDIWVIDYVKKGSMADLVSAFTYSEEF